MQEFIAEGDNQTLGPRIHIKFPPPPDLVVANVATPVFAFSGQPMSITWTVANQGAAAALSPWDDAVYMSADETLDASDQLLGMFRRQTEYQVVSTISFEFAFDLNNANFDATATTVNLTPPPDLEVDSVTAPATAQAGHAITFQYTATNRGATRTPNTSWTDSFYLSADDQLDTAADVFLGDRTVSLPGCTLCDPDIPPGLDVDGSYSREVTLTLPNGLEGEYFLFVAADRRNNVFEWTTPTTIARRPNRS